MLTVVTLPTISLLSLIFCIVSVVKIGVFCCDRWTLGLIFAKQVDNSASAVYVFGFDHGSDLSRTSEQTSMFTCAGLHETNPVFASRINMRTASKSVCSVL